MTQPQVFGTPQRKEEVGEQKGGEEGKKKKGRKEKKKQKEEEEIQHIRPTCSKCLPSLRGWMHSVDPVSQWNVYASLQGGSGEASGLNKTDNK